MCFVFRDVKDDEVLKKLLYNQMRFLTEQRHRELRAATRRLAYMSKLACAKKFVVSTEFMGRIHSCFESLEKRIHLEPWALREVEGVLDDCKQRCGSTWISMNETIDVSILDAPPEQVKAVF